MNWRLIAYVDGIVLVITGLFMMIPILASIIYRGTDLIPLLITSTLTIGTGLALVIPNRKCRKEDLRHRDGFFSVTSSWLLVSLCGALPYLLEGTFAGFTDAFFESMAGFTTTGASVLTDIESQQHGILLWRSLTQWLGGMGIVLISLAVLPMLGAGGMQLFKAEVPEISVDKLRPRIVDTAKSLWYIYTGLTALCGLLYYLGGMSSFDAINHAFTTLATGGFSTKNASLAFFDSSYIQLTATLFMFLGGVNYTLFFFAFKGNLGRFRESAEFRFYLSSVLMITLLITIDLWRNNYDSLFDSFRFGVFQVVSILTTTGYATADYEQWTPFAQFTILILMFFGGMIGSTSGSIKQIRILIMLKQIYREIYQLIHPRAVTFLKVDNRNMTKEILGSIWGFLFLFLIICIVATVCLTVMGIDKETSFSTVVSALCNVGPAFGDAGPTENYASLPSPAKWILIFCMLTGRLEIYTVIILFVPNFWKK
jgi:trk system potassium uptake protein